VAMLVDLFAVLRGGERGAVAGGRAALMLRA
jgi:hypothetical protein